jgi:hypothetical protein
MLLIKRRCFAWFNCLKKEGLFYILAVFFVACSTTSSVSPSLKGLAAFPAGLQYLVLPLERQNFVYYGMSSELFIFCQAPTMEQDQSYLKQQQRALALAWKNGISAGQKCYAQRVGPEEGDLALAQTVALAPVLLSCTQRELMAYCTAAIKALDQSNLSAQEVGQMFCQRPYQCRWNGEQLIILL